MKIWRRLQGLGAVTVKNSVYALPATEQTQEDLEWLLKEIVEGGGEGLICEARLIDGLSDDEARALFNAAREADYDDLAKEARELSDTSSAGGEIRAKLARLRSNLARIVAIDFFDAVGRETAEGLLGALEERLRKEETASTPDRDAAPADADTEILKGRVWVTRQGVYVDRIATAWLIRRFIDPDARFKFVPAKGYAPQAGELRFDMFDAEFTHEGDRCTFEVLQARTGLTDPGLTAIGEIVHDIDLKDGKFGREEAGGIARLIEGIAIANREDNRRLERGGAVFDDLYGYFRRRRG
ncbi:chromate resistance protein [Limobrevibacterium gyesilva]|uniref:chromate resistance protein n=1 Tax=Limobrevibacterium gyesilva TaxID=2991712 RepID=UPI0022263159